MFPNNEPMSFICAFYGCLTAGVVPVPIEVPLAKRVSSAFVVYSLLLSGPVWAQECRRISPLHFLAKCRKRCLNQASLGSAVFYCCLLLLVVFLQVVVSTALYAYVE